MTPEEIAAAYRQIPDTVVEDLVREAYQMPPEWIPGACKLLLYLMQSRYPAQRSNVRT